VAIIEALHPLASTIPPTFPACDRNLQDESRVRIRQDEVDETLTTEQVQVRFQVEPPKICYGRAAVLTSPRLWARDTACARFSTASSMKMRVTCDLTVSGAMERLLAISLLDWPCAISFRMSLSRALSGSAIGDIELGVS